MTAALVVPIGTLGESEAALLEVVRAGVLPVPVGVMIIAFAVIAMIAITNTTLVSVVTQSRILFGMAREGVVPRVFGKIYPTRRSPWVALLFSCGVVSALLIVGSIVSKLDPELDLVARLATVTVVFTLFIYALVIVSALKLRGTEEREDTFRANTILLWIGIAGNAILLTYVVIDDPAALYWVGGLLALGIALYVTDKGQTKTLSDTDGGYAPDSSDPESSPPKNSDSDRKG